MRMGAASLLTIVISIFEDFTTKQTINARTATVNNDAKTICTEAENSARKAMDLQFPFLALADSHTAHGGERGVGGRSPFTVTYCGPWFLSTGPAVLGPPARPTAGGGLWPLQRLRPCPSQTVWPATIVSTMGHALPMRHRPFNVASTVRWIVSRTRHPMRSCTVQNAVGTFSGQSLGASCRRVCGSHEVVIREVERNGSLEVLKTLA